MGDMNSLAGIDGYNQNIIKAFNEKQLKKFTTNGKLRFDAINKILDCGYSDSAVILNKNKINTVPTKGNQEDEAHGKMRLDYIFISDSLKKYLVNYSVIKNDLTDKASDHYPVVIELFNK